MKKMNFLWNICMKPIGCGPLLHQRMSLIKYVELPHGPDQKNLGPYESDKQ